jgi:hypothetical protein
LTIDPEDPLAVAVAEAIRGGDLDELRRLLAAHPGLATARVGGDGPGGETRTLLHVATDWPGHFPNGPATVAVLVEAGAEVTPGSAVTPTTRRRCTGRRAATTSPSSTPCWTPGPTSTPRAASSPAAHP